MASRQKIKGSKFERDVAKVFSDVSGEHYARSVGGSGGYVGGKNAHRMKNLSESQLKLVRGDIAVGESLNIIIECKHYADLGFHQLWDECKQLDKWIEQVQIDHNLSDSVFYCVIFKLDRKGSWIAFEEDAFDKEADVAKMRYYNKKSKRWFTVERFGTEWVERNIGELQEQTSLNEE